MTSDLSESTASLRLTEWTSCGGCAAKWGASVLAELVGDLTAVADPALLVGLAPFDDAAIYRIDETTALVSTTDFFPPLVDDPADYGAVAAANAQAKILQRKQGGPGGGASDNRRRIGDRTGREGDLVDSGR